MTPLAEPLLLRVSRDVLVLQPMHGHLDLEPLLLQPGLRCSIGSAEHCAVRLPASTIVHPEHCVIEAIGRKTMLIQWAAEATWLNDRVVTEPRELVPGDRVAVGPFDFHLRSATADELSYAQSVDQKLEVEEKVDQALPLKQALDDSDRDRTTRTAVLNTKSSNFWTSSSSRLGSNQSRDVSNAPADSTPERLTQHISKLLGNLQSQVSLLKEKETGLQEQIRRNRIDTASQPASAPAYGLLTERVNLERERILEAELAQCEKLRQKTTQRLQELEAAVEEFERERITLRRDQAALRKVAEEMIQKQQRLTEWEERLRETKLTPNGEREIASRHIGKQASPSERIDVRDPGVVIELEGGASQNRPIQTLVTLFVFGLSAFFLGIDLGHPEISTVIGWGAAALGVISTVDLFCRRLFHSGR